MCTLVTGFVKDGKASPPADKEHGLTLSDMQVTITSMGRTATFRLYDTVAAKEFYDQLPAEAGVDQFSRCPVDVLSAPKAERDRR